MSPYFRVGHKHFGTFLTFASSRAHRPLVYLVPPIIPIVGCTVYQRHEVRLRKLNCLYGQHHHLLAGAIC